MTGLEKVDRRPRYLKDRPGFAEHGHSNAARNLHRNAVCGGGVGLRESRARRWPALSEPPGTEVRISYRRDRFSRIKPKNRERMLQAAEEGRVEVLWSTELLENRPDSVGLRSAAKGANAAVRELPNDHLFIFAGGELPKPFLKRCGIQIDTKFGQP